MRCVVDVFLCFVVGGSPVTRVYFQVGVGPLGGDDPELPAYFEADCYRVGGWRGGSKAASFERNQAGG